MFKYVSIDLETTGLNEQNCQIIEFGAVIDDLKTPVEDLPKFHVYLDHEVFQGEPYALSMHQEIFRRIANKTEPYRYIEPYDLPEIFLDFLAQNGYGDEERVTVAGKNFASFDLRFLREEYGQEWESITRMRHRILDPGNMYFDSAIDEEAPNTETCLKRAGLTDIVTHTAVEDALLVVKLLRHAFSLNKGRYT